MDGACFSLVLSSCRLLVITFSACCSNSVEAAGTPASVEEVPTVVFNVSVAPAATAADCVESSCCGLKLYGQTGVGKGDWLSKESVVASPKWPEMPRLFESLL